MGKLSLTLIVVGTAACGSNNNNTVDAHIVVPIDAKPIDAPKVFNDAPPVNYDFSCLNVMAPATAAPNVTIAGTTQTLVGMAFGPLGTVTVDSYVGGTIQDTKVSDATLGTFTTAALATGGVPLNGYLKASTPAPSANAPSAYRTTYVYPPNPLAANLANVTVPLISTANFAQLALIGISQDDTTSGFMLITVADCTLKPITGAVLTVKQGTTEVGTQADLGQILPAFAGIFAVATVPDGDVTIGGSYNAMTFPTHVVHAYKQPTGNNTVGTITVSAVVPGWF